MAMLSRLRPYAYAALRIVAGSLFVFHGLQKLFGWFGGQQVPLASLLGAAGLIETVAGTLIAVALWAQPAAFLASGEMAAAYFMAHQPKRTWPIENQGELAALYCFIFLYIAASGAGPLGIDSLRGRGRRRL
jgi:putative oxidoreductase